LKVTRAQIRTLASLLFWIREKRIMQCYNNPTEQAEHSIKKLKAQAKRKKIPQEVTDCVLNARNVHVDILDIMKDNNIELIREGNDVERI
jgi:hypothetical protein